MLSHPGIFFVRCNFLFSFHERNYFLLIRSLSCSVQLPGSAPSGGKGKTKLRDEN